MSTNNRPVSCIVGFPVSLTIVFIVLKLAGFLTFSWLWVFSPIWLYYILFFSILLIVLLFAIAAELFK